MNKYLSIFLRAIGTIIVTFIFSHLLDIVVRILTNVFVGLVPPLLHSIFSFDLGTALNATLINQATGIGTAGSLALVDFDAYSPRLLMLGLIFGTLIAIVIFTLIIGLLARLVKGNRVFIGFIAAYLCIEFINVIYDFFFTDTYSLFIFHTAEKGWFYYSHTILATIILFIGYAGAVAVCCMPYNEE